MNGLIFFLGILLLGGYQYSINNSTELHQSFGEIDTQTQAGKKVIHSGENNKVHESGKIDIFDCKSVEKEYINRAQTYGEVAIHNIETFETKNGECIIAYSYSAEGLEYWNIHNISTDTAIYSDECMPNYNVEDDTIIYCSETDIFNKKQEKFEQYITKNLKRVKK